MPPYPMDPVEARLRDTVVREPADTHARQVYADWLEQHGWDTRATFLRLDAIDATPPVNPVLVAATTQDAQFRAAISRTKVARCVTFAFECPKRWSDLRAPANGADPFTRFCDHCQKPVVFVGTAEEAYDRGARSECIAIDPGVARGELESQYDRGDRTREMPLMMGAIAVQRPITPPVPPPFPPPKPDGVMKRIRGWFMK